MLQTEKNYRELWQGLTDKEKVFVSEYMIHHNAAKAARKAGYSSHCAKEIGYELLTKPHIAAAVEAGLAAMRERCEVDADRVVRELAAIGLSNISHYEADSEGHVQLIEDAPAEAMRAVASVRRKKRTAEDGSVVIETTFTLWNKLEALTLLGKKLRLWIDRVQTESPQDEVYKLLLKQLKEEQQPK